jgi:hypothetical protein
MVSIVNFALLEVGRFITLSPERHGQYEMALPDVRRPDFSNSLIHFTKARKSFDFEQNKPKPTVPAFEVIKEILASGILRGGQGYVKGNQRAICFSEIPLSAMHHFAQPPSDQNARYHLYGIALSKRTVFDVGGRPVIYLPDNEGEWIPADEKWRHVRFEYGSVDWTHEREWRVRGDLDLRKVPGLYVIVWSAEEAKELTTFNTPLREQIRGVVPMEHLMGML